MPSAPGFVASASLGLHALGNAGAAAIERGMHLRWGFETELGYPAEGFRLYRRKSVLRHNSPCLSIPPALLLTVLQQGWAPLEGGATIRVTRVGVPGAPGVGVPAQWRRFDVDLAQPALLQRVALQGIERPALVLAMLDGRPVATRHSTGESSPNMLFDYPMVDAVVVYTASGGPEAVCFADPQHAADGDWSANLLPAGAGGGDVGMGLPLTSAHYNLHHRSEDPGAPDAGDLKEARARLEGSGAPLDPDDFAELRSSLALMVDDAIPGRMFDREVFRSVDGASPFLERPLDLSLLFSLDSAMARVVGLYFVDTRVEPGESYDYLLMGRWAAWQLPVPASVYSFASVPEGTLVPRRFSLRGSAVTLPTQARVTSRPRDDGRPSRKGLLVRDHSPFWASDGPATIRFAAPQRWVLVELGARDGTVTLEAHRFGIGVDDAAVGAGDEPVTVLLRPSAGSLTEVELRGTDYVLYGWRAVPSAGPAVEPGDLDAPVSLGTLLLQVPFVDAPALASPSGLRLRGVPMPTSEQPALTLDDAEPPIHGDPQGLGLRWDPAASLGAPVWPADLDRRPPTEATGYELRYQFLGNDDVAAPIDADGWVGASDGRVSVAPPASPGQEPEVQPLGQGEDLDLRFPATAAPLAGAFPAEADLWLVPWIPEGWYAAEVRAVDAFGRTSAWVPGGPSLADAVAAPPPPAGVEAKLLQADDPELDAGERALVASHGDGCIRVRWSWPAHLRRQAPLARAFRVYLNRRPFNRVSGRIVAIGPGAGSGELDCTVELDEPLVAHGLVGANLVDAERTAFRVLANTVGPVATITVRQHVVLGSLRPAPGPASVTLPPTAPMFERPERREAWKARVARADVTASSTYEVVLPPLAIEPTRAEPVVHAVVGVATADDSRRAPDTFVQPTGPPWDQALAGLDGREGGVSTPAGVVARLFAPLDVAAPAPRDRLYTTRPDFFGRCSYELRWPHVPAALRPHVGWKVLRATDRALFGMYNPDPNLSRIDTAALPAFVRAELEAAFLTESAAAVSDDAIRLLAAQPGAERAFTAAVEAPLRSAAETMVLVDGVDGRNTLRYLWRMRTEDDAGNLSPLGVATDPVYVPNTWPPAAVKVAGCRGGERRVELSWVPNTELDLAGYLVYSTEAGLTADALEDLRLLRRPTGPESGAIEAYDRSGALVAPTLDLTVAAARALLQDGLVVVGREGLAGGATFHYRLAAYDTAGNPSTLGDVLTARTTGIERPPAPQWSAPVPQPDGLHLSWTAATSDLNCLLQRSVDGATWANVGGWLGRGNYQTVDASHAPGTPARYRLRVMQPNGQINRDFAVLEV